MLRRLDSQRLVALFAGGWLLFNFPLLGLWDQDVTVWGIPFFPLALLGLWAGLIAMLAWLMERSQDRFDERPDPQLDGRAPPPAPTEDQG